MSNPNEERLKEIQKSIGEFADIVPQAIVESWISGDFNPRETLQWIGTAIQNWRVENQKVKEKVYKEMAAVEYAPNGNRDAYFQTLHEKAVSYTLIKTREEIDNGWYRYPALLEGNMKTYYEYTMSNNYFFPIMNDEKLYKAIPEKFGITTWESFCNHYDTRYEKSKEVKYFADNNPWFCLTSLYYCHMRWSTYKEGKGVWGELFYD